MNKDDFNKLILTYGGLKAHNAMCWFRNNTTEDFRNSVSNQYQYCVDNEYLWNK